VKEDDRAEAAHADANLRAQKLWLKRIGSPVAARPRNVLNSTACMYRCLRVKRVKKSLFRRFVPASLLAPDQA
jgi:hypothetical protein